jgi:hypothetical protein
MSLAFEVTPKASFRMPKDMVKYFYFKSMIKIIITMFLAFGGFLPNSDAEGFLPNSKDMTKIN